MQLDLLYYINSVPFCPVAFTQQNPAMNSCFDDLHAGIQRCMQDLVLWVVLSPCRDLQPTYRLNRKWARKDSDFIPLWGPSTYLPVK